MRGRARAIASVLVTAAASLASLATSNAPPTTRSQVAEVPFELNEDHPIAEGVVSFRLSTDPGWSLPVGTGYVNARLPDGFAPAADVRLTITPQALPAQPITQRYGGTDPPSAVSSPESLVVHGLTLCSGCTQRFRYRVELLDPSARPVSATLHFEGTLSFAFDDTKNPELGHVEAVAAATTPPSALDAIHVDVPLVGDPSIPTAGAFAEVTVDEGDLGTAGIRVRSRRSEPARLSLLAAPVEPSAAGVDVQPADGSLPLGRNDATCVAGRCSFGFWVLAERVDATELVLTGSHHAAIRWPTPSVLAATDQLENRPRSASDNTIREATVEVTVPASSSAPRRGIVLVGWPDDSRHGLALTTPLGSLGQNDRTGWPRQQVVAGPCTGAACDTHIDVAVRRATTDDGSSVRVSWWAAAFTVDPAGGSAAATGVVIRGH